MSDQPQVKQGSGRQYDNPNQEVVRGDQSGPADEGEGGSDRVDPEPLDTGPSLDEMTKAELIDEAARRGVDVDDTATKAEIREALEA